MEHRKALNTRRAISLATKYEMVKDVEKGDKSKKTIAAKYGIASSTLSMIIKSKDVIEKMYNSNSTSSFRNSRKRLRCSFYPDLEDALCEWYSNSVVPVTRYMMIEKAMVIAKTLGYTNFKASYGFIERLKRRKDIVFHSKTSRSTQCNTDETRDGESIPSDDCKQSTITKNEQDESVEFRIDINELDRSEATHEKQVCSDHFVDGRPTEANPVPTLYLGFDKTVEGRGCFRKLRQGCISAPKVEQRNYPPGHLLSDYTHIADKRKGSEEKGYGIQYSSDERLDSSSYFEPQSSSAGEEWYYKQQYEDEQANSRMDDSTHSDYGEHSIRSNQADDRLYDESEALSEGISYYETEISSGDGSARKMKVKRFGQTLVTSTSSFRHDSSTDINRKRRKMTPLQQTTTGLMQYKEPTSTESVIPPEEIKIEQADDWEEENQEYSYNRQTHSMSQSQQLSTEQPGTISFAAKAESDVNLDDSSKSGTVIINLQDVNIPSFSTNNHHGGSSNLIRESSKTDNRALDISKQKLESRHCGGAVPVSLVRTVRVSPSENLGTISNVNEGSFTVSSKCNCCDQTIEVKVTEFKKLLKLFIKPEFLDELGGL